MPHLNETFFNISPVILTPLLARFISKANQTGKTRKRSWITWRASASSGLKIQSDPKSRTQSSNANVPESPSEWSLAITSTLPGYIFTILRNKISYLCSITLFEINFRSFFISSQQNIKNTCFNFLQGHRLEVRHHQANGWSPRSRGQRVQQTHQRCQRQRKIQHLLNHF